MPRPDLAAVGVKYRRIPVLSIGRDLYCDNALILEKLEQLYPGSDMGGTTGTDKALIKLLQKWTDLDVFARACESIPPDFPAMSDLTFLKDREELWGREWSKARQERMRAEALQSMRHNFDFLETMMADGEKEWVLESGGPSLADILLTVYSCLSMLPCQIQRPLGRRADRPQQCGFLTGSWR